MFAIILKPEAQKKLNKFDSKLRNRIVTSFEKLGHNPFPQGHKKLVNRNGYRIRVGDYRIVYEVYKTQIVIEICRILCKTYCKEIK